MDLERALRLVSRAEREALEEAEALRDQADAVLRAAASRTIDAESRIRHEYEADLAGMRSEMEMASRRATAAEAELDLLRAEIAELTQYGRFGPAGSAPAAPAATAPPEEVPLPEPQPAAPEPSESPVENIGDTSEDSKEVEVVQVEAPVPVAVAGLLDRMAGEADQLMAAASATAVRLHVQAAQDMSGAREDAARIRAAARREAEDLLTAAIAAIDRDTSIATTTREKAERDAQVALSARRTAHVFVERARSEAERIRQRAMFDAEVILEKARELAQEEINRKFWEANLERPPTFTYKSPDNHPGYYQPQLEL